MFLSRVTLILFLSSLLFCATPANALFGLAARREQKAALSAAREAYKSKDYIRTINIMEEFIFKNPPKRRQKRAYALIGNSYKMLGQNDKALLNYREAVEFMPKDIELNLSLAEIYCFGGLTDKAINIYEYVLTLQRGNAPARLGLARAYMMQGAFGHSLQYFEDYLNIADSKDAKVYYDYALSSFMANDNTAALKLALKSAELKDDAETNFLIAKIYRAEGNGLKALDIMKLICAAECWDDILLTYALWLSEDKARADEAVFIADNYLKKNPSSKLALFINFLAFDTLDEKARAKRYLEDIVAQDGKGWIDSLARKILKIKSKDFK
jgi:tetratricopeptide (TPR) repeat protein